MSNRFLSAVSALAIVPTLAIAQQPAQRPPAQRPPAARPAARPPAQQQRPAMARPTAGPQRGGSWEFTVGPALFSVDRNLNSRMAAAGYIDNNPSRFMYGGSLRIGYNFNEMFGISVGSGLGVGNSGMLVAPTVDLTWTSDLNKNFDVFIPVGINATRITDGGLTSANRLTSKYGVHAGLGVRSFLSENVALRVEGRMAYEDYSELSKKAWNGMGTVGLSFFAGGGPARDTDNDGVPDKKDRCASTPAGATVDATGCPRDSDHDGVYDGLDRCANTPANTPVTPDGCPRDTDHDGIADNLDRCPNTAAGTPVDANGCPRDADGDGVADNLDRCANTPRGTPVDANGCPRDSDNDSVADNLDRCPNTPAGTPVDANGCPRDADGDGVADNLDRCPGTPAGAAVDANGCPLAPDADRDGVPDTRDRCANTPAGRMVDANGCPYAELPAAGQALVLRNVTFISGSARLTPRSRTTLDGIATAVQAVLHATPSARFEIDGYTDNRGSAAANRRLSQARATSVMTYLVSKGVPRGAMSAMGFGPDNPATSNATAAGRAQNRRVEIKRGA